MTLLRSLFRRYWQVFFLWSHCSALFYLYQKDNLLDQKKDAIAILTQTATNILNHYNERVDMGELSREGAQALAVQQIRDLRYGEDNKDYFWITDLKPRMIMHPYRPDLEGQDLTNYSDLLVKGFS